MSDFAPRLNKEEMNWKRDYAHYLARLLGPKMVMNHSLLSTAKGTPVLGLPSTKKDAPFSTFRFHWRH